MKPYELKSDEKQGDAFALPCAARLASLTTEELSRQIKLAQGSCERSVVGSYGSEAGRMVLEHAQKWLNILIKEKIDRSPQN